MHAPVPTPIAVALPSAERDAVCAELAAAGFEPVVFHDAFDLAERVAERPDLLVAIVDAQADVAHAATVHAALGREGRPLPALVVGDPVLLDALEADGLLRAHDEVLPRPYAAESLRWRVEAMCIRAAASGAAPRLAAAALGGTGWTKRGQVVAVFNPKGGVGKTTIATNLAAALATRYGRQVLLVDADTVTGHVLTSLGLDGTASVSDAWRDHAEDLPEPGLDEIAASHVSGLRVTALTTSPIDVELLDPARVAAAVGAARRGADDVIVDLHPSYSPLNRALFDQADRILLPVTPDVPSIRAAVQLRDVADQLGLADRLAMVVNRADSGVRVADVEAVVGMPAWATIRSAGTLFVRAANEGRTVIELAPRSKVADDVAALARLVAGVREPAAARRRGLFGWLPSAAPLRA